MKLIEALLVLREKFQNRDEQIAQAEALGFDTSKVYYHGTTRNFRKFKPGREDRGVNELGLGVYLATDTWHASAWANAEKGQVYPCFVRKGPVWDWDVYLRANDSERKSLLAPIVKGWVRMMNDQFSITGYSGASMEDGWELVQRLFDVWWPSESSNKFLKWGGFIGSVKKDSQVPTQICVFDPSDIRSIFAKFKKPDGSLTS